MTLNLFFPVSQTAITLQQHQTLTILCGSYPPWPLQPHVSLCGVTGRPKGVREYPSILWLEYLSFSAGIKTISTVTILSPLYRCNEILPKRDTIFSPYLKFLFRSYPPFIMLIHSCEFYISISLNPTPCKD